MTDVSRGSGLTSKKISALLRLSAQTGSSSGLRSRIAAGDDLAATDEDGRAAIHIAAARGHLDACELLLAAGADASVKDKQGATPVDLAKSAGHERLAEYLNRRIAASQPWSKEIASPAAAPSAVVNQPREAVCDGFECVATAASIAFDLDESGAASPTEPILAEMPGVWVSIEEHSVGGTDVECLAEAVRLSDIQTIHRPINNDASWDEVLLELPVIFRGNAVDTLGPANRDYLLSVLRAALAAGCIDPLELSALLIGTPQEPRAEELQFVDVFERLLALLGVPVECGAPPVDFLNLQVHDEAELQDHLTDEEGDQALHTLVGSVTARDESHWAYLRDVARCPPLLEASEEFELGEQMDRGLASALKGALVAEGTLESLLELAEECLARQAQNANPEPSVALAQAVSGVNEFEGEIPAVTEIGTEEMEWLDSAAREAGATDTSLESDHNFMKMEAAQDLVGLIRQAIAGAVDDADVEAHLAMIASHARPAGIGREYLRMLAEQAILTLPAGSRVEVIEAGLQEANEARERLILCNLKLCVSMARRYFYSGVPIGDLVQEGNIGLMKSVDRFEQRRGFRFSTYATWWIKQSISRSIADSGRLIRLPVYVHEQLNQLRRVWTEDRAPDRSDAGDVAAKLGISESKAERLIASWSEPLSLNSDEGCRAEWLTQEAGEQFDPEAQLAKLDEIRLLLGSLKGLKAKEELIIRMRHGLAGIPEHTLEEVGRALEVTRERVRQIEAKVMRKLKDRLGALQDVKSSLKEVEVPEAEKADTEPSDRLLLPPSSSQSDTPVRAALLDLISQPADWRNGTPEPRAALQMARRWFAAFEPNEQDHVQGRLQLFSELSDSLRSALKCIGFRQVTVQTEEMHRHWTVVRACASKVLEVLDTEGEQS